MAINKGGFPHVYVHVDMHVMGRGQRWVSPMHVAGGKVVFPMCV